MRSPSLSAPGLLVHLVVLGSVTLLGSLAAPGLLAQVPLPAGPLRIGEQNPLYRLQYVPEAEPVDVVAGGELSVSLITAYSNIFEDSSSPRHDHLFDLEQMTNVLGMRYGVAERWETGLDLAFHTGWGGFLDGFVSGFHGAFGFPNGGREEEPDGQHEVRLLGSEPDVALDLPARTLGLEGVSVFTKWQPAGADGGAYGLSLRGTARASTGPLDTGRTDYALGVQGRISGSEEGFRGTHMYGAATWISLDPAPSLDALFSRSAMAFFLGFERRITPGVAGVLQLSAGTPYVQDPYGSSRLSRFPSTLSFGAASRGDGPWSWSFAFTEDFPPESPTVDFTLTLGVHRRIGL